MVCEPITFILIAYSARRPMHTSWYVWKVHEMCETENSAHAKRPCKPESALLEQDFVAEGDGRGTLSETGQISQERQTSQTPDSGGTFERMMHDINKLCMSAHTTARGKLTKDKSSACLRLRIVSVLSQKSDGLLDSTYRLGSAQVGH